MVRVAAMHMVTVRDSHIQNSNPQPYPTVNSIVEIATK